jgi:hypothetical protein
MMQRQDSGGIIMLISEPTDSPSPSTKDQQTITNTNDTIGIENQNKSNSLKSNNNSRFGSRRTSLTTATTPNLLMPSSIPKSRKISTMNYSSSNESRIITEEETAKCLLSVAQHLTTHDVESNSSDDFVVHYPIEYDPSEQEHLITFQVEILDDSLTTVQDVEAKRGYTYT